MDKDRITVVGGGLAGLVSAISCAESGRRVRLFEAHQSLGGRGRSAPPPFRASFGPHALYKGRTNWAWLAERDLLPPVAKPSPRGLRYRHHGKIRRTPPLGLARVLTMRRHEAPVDSDFRSWAASRCGETTAAMLCSWAGAFTFDPDPGRLSAAFVWDRFRWIYLPPAIRHVLGGWGTLVDLLEARARELGVAIETGDHLRSLPEPPVIVATELGEAAELLNDPTLRPQGPRAVLLDIGLTARRRDPSAVLDLDQGILIESFGAAAMAPSGQELIQAHAGIEEDADPQEAVQRIESLLDATYKDWRDRVLWRRRQLSHAKSGALDLPGATWADRPSIERGGGVFLAGDQVAAPGLLSEVSFNSGVAAAHLACAQPQSAPLPTLAAS